jgi:hypothetical protein
MGSLLLERGQRRIPSFHQLLDGAYIDISIVKKLVEGRHMLCQEPAILPDRVSTQWRVSFPAVRMQKFQSHPFSPLAVIGRGFSPFQKAGGLMMGLGPLIHGHEDPFRMVYGDVGSLSHRSQIAICDHGGYLQNDMRFWIDARHF